VRTRIALLVAAAAVFAPGWGADAPARSTSSVVGRMLAPNLEEGSIASPQGATRGLSTWDRSQPTSLWPKISARPSQYSGLFSLELLCAAVAVAVLFGRALRPTPRSPRAPPYLTA